MWGCLCGCSKHTLPRHPLVYLQLDAATDCLYPASNTIEKSGTGCRATVDTCCATLMERRDSVSIVMLATPSNLIRGRLVRSRAKWMFDLPHLSCHDSAECFCPEDLAFDIEVVGLCQACGTHLDPTSLNFHCHGTTRHITQSQIFGIESVAGREGFTLAVSQDVSIVVM